MVGHERGDRHPECRTASASVQLRYGADTVAIHRDRTAIAGVLIMFALMSFLPFVAGLVAAIRERGAWLDHPGRGNGHRWLLCGRSWQRILDLQR